MSLINSPCLSARRRGTQRGLAAIEFALTLPIMIALLVGSADIAYMMLLSQRVDRVAYAVTDIVSQSETVPSRADLDTIMLAAGQLMQPFPFGNDGVVVVTSVYRPTGQGPRICWQHASGGSLVRSSLIGAPGEAPNMPNGLTINEKENVIISEVFYDFRPMFINAGILSAGDFYRVAVYKPRLSLLCDPAPL